MSEEDLKVPEEILPKNSPEIIMSELKRRPNILEWPWGSAHKHEEARGIFNTFLGYFSNANPSKSQQNFEMSKCLDLLKSNEEDTQIFDKNQIDIDDFNTDP